LSDRYQRLLIKNNYSKDCFSHRALFSGHYFFFYIVYILYDLLGIINDISKPTIFADTNIIFTHSNYVDFKNEINIVIEKISKWFKINSLILNFNKTHYMQFMTKLKLAVNIHISYKADITSNSSSTNFLGLTLDSTLSWKTLIKQLSSKLNSACYLAMSLRSITSMKNLRTIYFSYVHSITTNGIIFWGTLPYSDNIFKIQKITRGIMMNVGNQVSCPEFF
jgi:hypothetical protein